MIQRLTSYKIWISNLVNSPYIETSGEFESNYVEFEDKKISRVNIIATIVDKNESEDRNYISLLLDDGSEQIRVKAWKEDTRLLSKIYIGDIILIIGKIKKYNDQFYILPEIVKNLDLNWEIARKLELLKIYGKPSLVFKNAINDEKSNIEEINFSLNDLRSEILNVIEKHEDGVTLESLKLKLHAKLEDLNKVIEELVKEGQIYLINDKFRLLR